MILWLLSQQKASYQNEYNELGFHDIKGKLRGSCVQKNSKSMPRNTNVGAVHEHDARQAHDIAGELLEKSQINTKDVTLI